jgi:hypothetical protein
MSGKMKTKEDLLKSDYIEHLRCENEYLYNKLLHADDSDSDTLGVVEKALVFIEFKEYFMSSTMRIIDIAIEKWNNRLADPVDTSAFRSRISERMRNDNEFLLQVYEFSDMISKIPFLSITVDSVRMFIVNYFMFS